MGVRPRRQGDQNPKISTPPAKNVADGGQSKSSRSIKTEVMIKNSDSPVPRKRDVKVMPVALLLDSMTVLATLTSE